MSDCQHIQQPQQPQWEAEQLWDKIQSAHPMPLSAMVSLTARCNLACAHCEVHRTWDSDRDELELEQHITVLDQLAEAGVLVLSLTGGEPAVRKDLEEIVKAAVDRRFCVKLKTNATLLPAERIDKLAGYGLWSMDVSLYSRQPAEHDRFVGQEGAFNLALKAMERFRSLGGEVRVSAVMMNWNANRFSALLDFCENNGFLYMVDLQIAPRSDGGSTPTTFRATEEEIASALTDPRIANLSALVKVDAKPEDRFLCIAGRGSLFVNYNGDLWPCARLPWTFGNLLESPISTLWTDSKKRQHLLDLRWSDLPECSSCTMSAICWRCPAIALIEHGSILDRSDVACTVARAFSTDRSRKTGP